MRPFDWDEHWLPVLTAARLWLGRDPPGDWLAEVGGVDWSGLPCGWLL